MSYDVETVITATIRNLFLRTTSTKVIQKLVQKLVSTTKRLVILISRKILIKHARKVRAVQIFLTINICCSIISINTINFSLIRAVYFLILFVDSLRSKVLYILKITQQEFIESIYSRNISLFTCCFSKSICLSNKKLSISKYL